MKKVTKVILAIFISIALISVMVMPAMAAAFWESDSEVVSGLVGAGSAPTVFNKDGTWYLISGEAYGNFYGYNWTGSEWQPDPLIISGLGNVGWWRSSPTVFNKDGTWYLISGEYYGGFYGYKWTGSEWQSDPAIASGLGVIGFTSMPTVFYKDETWYLISGNSYEEIYGWHQVKTADLTTTAINVPELFVNQPSTITATIANAGDADATSFNVSLSVNGSVVDTVNVPSLGVGNSTNVSFEWTPVLPGENELCVVADSDDTIDEIYEANNKKCIPVTVNAPDLTPTAINVPELFVNQPSTITATIDNVGTADAGPFNVSRSADESVVDTVSVQSLSANGSTNVSFEWTPASAGNYRLCVVADSDNAIDELDETNNETCIPVTVSEIPEEIVWWYLDANIPFDAERLSNNNTLITDCINERVIEVNSSGAIVWQYGNGTPGNGINQLNHPRDAERLENGNTLIADRLNNRVIEVRTSDYDPTQSNNGFTAASIVWQVTGLNHPVDADLLPNGNMLIVVYKDHGVIEVTPAGEIVRQYGSGTEGSGVNQLNYPEDAERLENGNTLIADRINNRIIEVRTSDYDPIRPNNGFTTRSIVWEYESDSPPDAERLENGNTLICEATRVIEVVTPPAELKPSTPFMIFGEVKSDTGEPVQNLTVTIKNVNTTEDFVDVDIYVSENRSFYQLLTVSGHVLAGDVLHFVASNGNTNESDYPVTLEDMNHGGFVLNITIVRPLVPMPDLTVTEKNETLLEDGTFTVNYTVKNIGGDNAGASNTTIYIDGVPKKEDSVPALAAGASYTNTVGPFECPCNQTLNVTVCADNNDVVDESEEGNNCLSNELVCPVCIEFIEANVRIEPETLNLGSQGQFTAYISLPEPYDVENISISTVKCEGANVSDGNFASAGGGTLVAKFDRQGLRADLPTGDAVMMTVTGELQRGVCGIRHCYCDTRYRTTIHCWTRPCAKP